MTSHTAAGKLLGMKGDALWYEAAHVVGVTNALNVVADGLSPYPGVYFLEPVSEGDGNPEVETVFDEIRRFYMRDDVPLTFRLIAHEPRYLKDLWTAVRRAFDDNRLSRRLKESLAFSMSVTTRSAFGTEFHLNEMRRLGVTQKGIMEVLGVTQMFSSFTKIADFLQLEPDMSDIAPIDMTPVPGSEVKEEE